MDLFKPNYFPKALPPDTLMLGVRASTDEFGRVREWGGVGHIQSIISVKAAVSWNSLFKFLTKIRIVFLHGYILCPELCLAYICFYLC